MISYFRNETALSINTMEEIVQEAMQEETRAEQIQSILEGVAGYMIGDLLDTIAELHEMGALRSVDDVCTYLYHLFDEEQSEVF